MPRFLPSRPPGNTKPDGVIGFIPVIAATSLAILATTTARAQTTPPPAPATSSTPAAASAPAGTTVPYPVGGGATPAPSDAATNAPATAGSNSTPQPTTAAAQAAGGQAPMFEPAGRPYGCPPCPPTPPTQAPIAADPAPTGSSATEIPFRGGATIGVGVGLAMMRDSIQGGGGSGGALDLRAGFALGQGRWVIGLDLGGGSSRLEGGGSYNLGLVQIFGQYFWHPQWAATLGFGGANVTTTREGATLRKASGALLSAAVTRELRRFARHKSLSAELRVATSGTKVSSAQTKDRKGSVGFLGVGVVFQWW